uniref:NAD kinase putative n=1 Tax=Albugo laibachii Nc14 TaxID=890382 RepID=F0WPG0_9STRA|nr:NAD kinase putative [Albugo laibachii Nc14]|eukprot:CCA23208.1 NAD kinase putative [Albugo laibachii Nc14]
MDPNISEKNAATRAVFQNDDEDESRSNWSEGWPRKQSSASSQCSNSSTLTIEEDIKAMQEQLQRVLTFCALQAENPLRLQQKISDLLDQLRLVIAEKNYWMKRASRTELAQVEPTDYEDEVGRQYRRRSNSELQVMADTIASTGREVVMWEEQEGKSPKSAVQRFRYECGSSQSTTDTFVESLTQPTRPKCTGNKQKKAPFRLLQCSDQQCEVFTPPEDSIRVMHRARNNVHFMWDESPRTVLIIKKPNEPEVTDTLVSIASWLTKKKKLRVVVEPSVHAELKLKGTETWVCKEQWSEYERLIDFVVTLGGDGTILWVSSLFEKSVPPVLSFAMGSLGFLAPFDSAEASDHLDQVINGGFCVSLRSRLCGTILRKDKSTEPLHQKLALNEILIDRGHNAGILELVCFCDGLEITKIAADGIIIATPTGSTAYSLSAGGSMTHPSVPSMLFTPICPHTLSFRPLLFPDSATIKILLPMTSRAASAYVSFDGKNRVRLERGDAVVVRVSAFPVPSICRKNENHDWFDSVVTNLNWNVRKPQKPLQAQLEYQ